MTNWNLYQRRFWPLYGASVLIRSESGHWLTYFMEGPTGTPAPLSGRGLKNSCGRLVLRFWSSPPACVDKFDHYC